MAKLTPQQFAQKYLARFATNTTGNIKESDLREFAQDAADSFGGSTEFSQLNLAWNAQTTYNTTDVQYAEANDRLYKSKQNGNTGHPPPADPDTNGIYQDAWWIEISRAENNLFREWTPGIYGTGLVIVYYENSFRKLEVLQRPFESVDIIQETADKKWRIISGTAGSFVRISDSGDFDGSTNLITWQGDQPGEVDLWISEPIVDPNDPPPLVKQVKGSNYSFVYENGTVTITVNETAGNLAGMHWYAEFYISGELVTVGRSLEATLAGTGNIIVGSTADNVNVIEGYLKNGSMRTKVLIMVLNGDPPEFDFQMVPYREGFDVFTTVSVNGSELLLHYDATISFEFKAKIIKY